MRNRLFIILKLSNLASAKLLLPDFKMLLIRLNIYDAKSKKSLTIQPAFECSCPDQDKFFVNKITLFLNWY
ncbi:unnamed protein product [Oikopleura dioica]|uniref:Uncharacterized protein n=1 Tax=Oikopleura dioica TaxID=34765 RepID=E4XYW0_OIKDI|nr:unnamed protein product [Oikopleura dioica]